MNLLRDKWYAIGKFKPKNIDIKKPIGYNFQFRNHSLYFSSYGIKYIKDSKIKILKRTILSIPDTCTLLTNSWP